MIVEIYTDGSCEPNPGVGGWAAILKCGNHRREISGHLSDATNNTAELTAVIEGLKAVKGDRRNITIYTDSQYAARAIYGMRKPTANFELLAHVRRLCNRHHVTAVWVRGHGGNAENERADQLANEARNVKR